MRILGVDLAAAKSGWCLLDTATMQVVAWGTVLGDKDWDARAWQELYYQWEAVVWPDDPERKAEVVVIETPGMAGQSGPGGRWGTKLATRLMLAQAQVPLGIVAAFFCVQVVMVDQAEVKAQLCGRPNATKSQVRHNLELRQEDGEFSEADFSRMSEDETDALAVCLVWAQRQKIQECDADRFL